MKDFSNGDVFLAYFKFNDNENDKRAKVRPVAIFEDPETKHLYVCQISSNISKPIVAKIGYVIKDWEEAGLDKPSFVSCEKKNVRLLNPTTILDPIGKLSQRDISGMLIKRIKVLEQEHQYMLAQKEGNHSEKEIESTKQNTNKTLHKRVSKDITLER